MKEIRILLTGAGRRVELVQAFRMAALRLNINLKLYAADMDVTAPALPYCDYSRKICSMRDSMYIHQLLEISVRDKIDLVIPTIDTDLLVLSKNIEEFEKHGVRLLISKPEKIFICRDKNRTYDFFISCGLKAPRTYNNYKEFLGPYPCFIKPKDGSSSVNAFKVNNQKQLSVFAEQIKDYIIQPFVSGKEYTIDIFCDFNGNPIFITPRERIQVRAGEVLKTKICMDEIMIKEAKRICEFFRPCGPLTVQLIQDKATGVNYFIEINPRFGGGAPLSMKAGARSAETLLQLIDGKKIEYQADAVDCDSIYSRFDQSVCITRGNDAQAIKGVIFDLDDTLYSEKQYLKSGFKKIAQYLGRKDAEEKMWDYFEEGKLAIDEYLTEIGEQDLKAECLDIYRNQYPEISLYAGVKELIEELKEKGIKIGIITDGRPVGQRNKLKALGLNELIEDVIITDELGGVQFRKPCDIAFRIMQNRWRIPFEQLIYIADNPIKDFHACRQLGMKWKYYKNKDAIHYNDCGVDAINTITEFQQIFFS